MYYHLTRVGASRSIGGVMPDEAHPLGWTYGQEPGEPDVFIGEIPDDTEDPEAAIIEMAANAE